MIRYSRRLRSIGEVLRLRARDQVHECVQHVHVDGNPMMIVTNADIG